MEKIKRTCKEMGWKVGDKFLVYSDEQGSPSRGDVVTLVEDDGTATPFYCGRGKDERFCLYSYELVKIGTSLGADKPPSITDKPSIEEFLSKIHPDTKAGVWQECGKPSVVYCADLEIDCDSLERLEEVMKALLVLFPKDKL